MTDQPRHPHPRPGARHPRRPPPAARRALTVLGALLLSLAAAAATAPAASATPPPPEPPPGPPPPPPAVPVPGLPLWAVLVILGGTIALSAATTLITLALHPTAPAQPRRPRPGHSQAPAPTASQARRPPAHQRSHPAHGHRGQQRQYQATRPSPATPPRRPRCTRPIAHHIAKTQTADPTGCGRPYRALPPARLTSPGGGNRERRSPGPAPNGRAACGTGSG